MPPRWTPGVFASIWQRYNNRSLKYTTWIVCDGPGTQISSI